MVKLRRIRVAGIARQEYLEFLYGIRGPPRIPEHHRQHVSGLARVRPDRDRPAESVDGSSRLPSTAVHKPQVEERAMTPFVAIDRALVEEDGFVPAPGALRVQAQPKSFLRGGRVLPELVHDDGVATGAPVTRRARGLEELRGLSVPATPGRRRRIRWGRWARSGAAARDRADAAAALDATIGQLTEQRVLTRHRGRPGGAGGDVQGGTGGGPVLVELTHDALITRWGRFTEWRESSRAEP